ncbi:Calcineurin subunit B [Cladochytrium tenue]|nr:Calcineurin subunit B [Cladochytrium tenue]
MGANISQLEEMVASTNFTADEIQRLYKRFVKLDKDGSGTIDKDEFLALPQIASNPLAARLLSVLDGDGTGDIDFKEFITGLSAFSAKGNKEEKLRFAFKVYDMDRDGFISNGELFLVLKMMVGNNLRDQQLQQIVDKTIMEADLDKDGKISFDEFTKMVENTDIARQMTVESDRQITYYVLIAEVAVYLLSLVPLGFVPVRSKKQALHWLSGALNNETVKWLWRMILLVVAGVFVDTISRLLRLDSSLRDHHGPGGHAHSVTETTIEDLQYKTKLFYSQRNLYLSVMSLFMVLVLFRRMKDVFLILQLQEGEESNKTTIKALKEQVNILIKSTDGTGPEKKSAAASEEASSSSATATPERLADPTEKEGIRKRGTKTN